MKLSTRARYGLRAVVDLALHRAWQESGESRQTVSLSELSKRQEIPLDYLRQIFLALKRAGLILSVRGRKGGVMLTKPPSEITAMEILEALDEDTALVPCITAPSKCRRSGHCSTRPLWNRLHRGIQTLLSSTSIAQLAAECPKEGMAALPSGLKFDI